MCIRKDIMDSKKWLVYMHTNIINGKKYIGITSRTNPNHRWSNGHGYKENTHFRSAINKYGWENFSHDILLSGLSKEEANAKEKFFIKEWNTQNSEHGYNMTEGGDGSPGCHPSEETRKKLSELRKRENLSEETLLRRSQGLRGRKFSEEHKKKIGIANSKAVLMYSKNMKLICKYNSITQAEKETGISHTHISQCCKGQRKTTGGYVWAYAV